MLFMTINNLSTPNQHDFVPKKSCLSSLLIMLDQWTAAIQEDFNVNAIYIDFTKTFDLVPYKKLLFKLKKYGYIYKWFCISMNKRFLLNQRQSVTVNLSHSHWLSTR